MKNFPGDKSGKEFLYFITDNMIIIGSEKATRESSFAKEERENPIFFPSNILDEEITTFIIPEGFKVTYVPEDLDLDIGFFRHKRNYKTEGNKLTISTITRYVRKEIPVERYNDVRDFYNQLPQKTNQRIIAKKITNQ